MSKEEKPISLDTFLDWLAPRPEPVPFERAERHPRFLWACSWDGGDSNAAPVKNISSSGAYIHFPARWYIGTILRITLQRGTGELDSQDSITLLSKVVRHGPDGMGVAFMFDDADSAQAIQRFIEASPVRGPVLVRRRDRDGQALIEFALMVPLLFLLIFNAVNFGGFLYSWITISNAARAGGQYAAMGASYASYPTLASLGQVATLIQSETSSLPGASGSNPAVTICENRNGTAVAYPPTYPTAACGSGTAPPQDPETITGLGGASTYTTVAIDVTYTYTPFIGAFNTGFLGIVSPPTTVHRRTVMRVLN